MIEAGSPRGPGGLGWPGGRIVGRGRRRRFGFGEDLGDVEEMTLARSVAEPLAALAEEVATQQGQGLGQFVVSLLQLLVIGRGPVEDAFEFVDAALRVFSLLRGGLGSLPQSILLEQAFEFVDAALSRLGISMPSWELFDDQDPAYRDSVLPPGVTARVSVEQASVFGWARYVSETGQAIGMRSFGASAPLKDLLREFGFTVERVVAAAKAQLGSART